MEGVETAELLQLMHTAYEAVDVQFQAWMAITFAAIVAVYTGRNDLGIVLRITIAVLYLLGSVSLVLRWGFLIEEIDLYQAQLSVRGIDINPQYWPAARIVTWTIGTVVTCICVFTIKKQDSDGTK